MMMQYTKHIDMPVQIRRIKHPVKQRKNSSVKAQSNADKLILILNEWMADESGYDEETFPELKANLNRERDIFSARRLFNE